MEWLEQLNGAINYIEKNLTKEIDYDKAAQIACCSTFHFRRIFSYIAGVSLSEYIRRRKMTLAAFDLQSTESKVIDISLKYGYESPTAFNRAFQSVHHISPQKAKKKNVVLKSYLPISFKIQVKGDSEMNYKIVTKDSFRIVGAKKHFEMNIEENFKEVPTFWRRTAMKGMIPKIVKMNNQEPKGLLGISTCINGKDFDYYIAAATNMETKNGMDEFTVPRCTWAVFECIGPMPQAIQDLQKRIITEWLPTSGYEYANAPDIELYTEGNQSAADYRSEIWLPIQKKETDK